MVIVLDSSTSVGKDNWQLQLDFVKNILSSLSIGLDKNRVGFVTFNTAAKVVFGLSKFKNAVDVTDAVKKTKFTEGVTATGDALKLARTQVLAEARPGVPKVLLLVTDGKTNLGVNPITEADKLKKQGVKLITVGITDDIDT